ncbi:MAG: DapH/DapD/GlmU-related protein, partial [Calditrichaeota bacterium]|nr:DapH/DapD/GlmU-related protein [Calditrichota bacterium]
LHPFKEHRFVVVGDKAMVVFDDTQEKDKLVLYDCGIDFVKGEPVKRDQETRVVPFDAKEPLKIELEHFMKCVSERTQPMTDAWEALDVLRVLNTAQRSLDGSPAFSKPSKNRDYFVHDTAVVDAGAQIGKGTKIWHFSHVMPQAKIGAQCSLGQNVFVANNVVIGNNVKIQNNISVYEGVILEDDTFCAPSVVFTNVKNPRSAIPRNTSHDYLQTTVKRGATLGANCTIVCGISIGENAFIAAGAVATGDVKPNALMAGVPAKQIGWMCDCGFKLEQHNVDLVCPECSARYSLENGSLIILR